MRSSATKRGNAVNGRKLYVMPDTTATGPASTRKSSGRRPKFFNGPKSTPSSARMKFHCTVRITNDTKNGTKIRKKSVDFHLPA